MMNATYFQMEESFVAMTYGNETEEKIEEQLKELDSQIIKG